MLFSKKKEFPKDYRKTGLETNYSNYGWYTCVHCGKKFRKNDIDIDHIIPKSLGGTNDPKNLQCLCKHCNRSKQADTSRTKQDLKNRKITYGQCQRAPYFREKIKAIKKEFRENDLPKLTDAELIEWMECPDFTPLKTELRREARKRGLIQ